MELSPTFHSEVRRRQDVRMTRSVVQLEHIGVNAGGDCIASRQVALQFRSCRDEVRQCVNARIGVEEIEIATVIGKRHRVG